MNHKLDEYDELKTAVLAARKYGKVLGGARWFDEPRIEVDAATVGLPDGYDQADEINFICRYLESEGYAGNETGGLNGLSGWTFLNALQVTDLLAELIRADLAYKSEIVDAGTARSLAERFVTLFDARDVLYLSNGALYNFLKTGVKGSDSYTQLTGSTFEGGVIGFDGKMMAYLWFADED